MQEQLFELGQRTPRLFIIQSKQFLTTIFLASLIVLFGVLGSSAAERITKLSCLQTEPTQFRCEISLTGVCPQTGPFLSLVSNVFVPVEQRCVSNSTVLLKQSPNPRVFFIAIAAAGVVLWGWFKTSSRQKYMP